MSNTVQPPVMKKCNRCNQKKLLSSFPLIDYKNTNTSANEKSRALVVKMKDHYKDDRRDRCEECMLAFDADMNTMLDALEKEPGQSVMFEGKSVPAEKILALFRRHYPKKTWH